MTLPDMILARWPDRWFTRSDVETCFGLSKSAAQTAIKEMHSARLLTYETSRCGTQMYRRAI